MLKGTVPPLNGSNPYPPGTVRSAALTLPSTAPAPAPPFPASTAITSAALVGPRSTWCDGEACGDTWPVSSAGVKRRVRFVYQRARAPDLTVRSDGCRAHLCVGLRHGHGPHGSHGAARRPVRAGPRAVHRRARPAQLDAALRALPPGAQRQRQAGRQWVPAGGGGGPRVARTPCTWPRPTGACPRRAVAEVDGTLFVGATCITYGQDSTLFIRQHDLAGFVAASRDNGTTWDNVTAVGAFPGGFLKCWFRRHCRPRGDSPPMCPPPIIDCPGRALLCSRVHKLRRWTALPRPRLELELDVCVPLSAYCIEQHPRHSQFSTVRPPALQTSSSLALPTTTGPTGRTATRTSLRASPLTLPPSRTPAPTNTMRDRRVAQRHGRSGHRTQHRRSRCSPSGACWGRMLSTTTRTLGAGSLRTTVRAGVRVGQL